MLLLLLYVALFILSILVLYIFLRVIPVFDSHFKATEHELTSVWTHINMLENGDSYDSYKEDEREEFYRKEGLSVDD